MRQNPSEQCITPLKNSIEGTIEAVIQGVINYFSSLNIAVIGVGERLHIALPLVYVFIPYFLPALTKLGFKQLLFELLYADTKDELKDVYGMLNKHAKEPTEEKIRLLKDIILGDPRRFRVLNLQYRELEAKDSYYRPYNLLLLIVRAYELGVKLYGIVNSKEMQKVNNDEEEMYLIGESGRKQAEILKLNGKLIVYGGDAHVGCKALNFVVGGFDNPERIVFGADLFSAGEMNKKYKYINLTILCGTEKIFDKAPDAFLEAGRNFYKKEFRTLKPGMARAILITAEDEHRIILLYNNTNSYMGK